MLIKYNFRWMVCLAMFSGASYALDLGHETPADRADHFDFESFHKEKGVTLIPDGNEKQQKQDTDSPQATQDKSGVAVIEVHEHYRLGNDPSQLGVPTLFEAIESLHRQLYKTCQQGWDKVAEWHVPEQSAYVIYYQAHCR